MYQEPRMNVVNMEGQNLMVQITSSKSASGSVEAETNKNNSSHKSMWDGWDD